MASVLPQLHHQRCLPFSCVMDDAKYSYRAAAARSHAALAKAQPPSTCCQHQSGYSSCRNVVACLLLSESPTTAYLRSRGALVEHMHGQGDRTVGYLAPHVHLSRGQEQYLRSGRLDCKAHPAISLYMQKLDGHRCDASQPVAVIAESPLLDTQCPHQHPLPTQNELRRTVSPGAVSAPPRCWAAAFWTSPTCMQAGV